MTTQDTFAADETANLTLLKTPQRDEFAPIHRIVYCFEVLFDTQIDPETWARWLASFYVTQVEFHSYMPAHELVDTGGDSWNSHAGDPRLWTSRRALQEKIAALHRYGISAILYASAYAASPAFFSRYPDWAAYWPDGRPVFFPDIKPPYLVIQAMRRDAHAPHKINGVTYNNYREYISAEVTRATLEYNFDGVRMDFYAIPDTYISPSFAGTSNISDDLVDFMADLRRTLKAAKPDTIITVIELPNVDGDRIRRGVARDQSVDVHWLELWPQDDQTGPAYADLIHEIRLTRQMAPEAGIVAAYYPQNPPYEGYPLLPDGWPAPNIQYNFATAFAAGSSWGGQSVGGHGSFTQVLPFKFAYMDPDRLSLMLNWNRFMTEYGSYYTWDSAIYRFEPQANPVVNGEDTSAVKALLYARRDRRNDNGDALVLHLINYGPNNEWAQLANEPHSLVDLTISLPLGPGQQARRVIALEPGTDPVNIDFEQHDSLVLNLARLEYYKLIVVELTDQPTLPPRLASAPAIDARRPEPFDIGGNAIWQDAERITILDEEPLFAISNFSKQGDEWVQGQYEWSDDDAFSYSHSYKVSSGRVKFSATKKEALRFNLNNFPLVSFAWKAVAATQTLIAFEVVNMDNGAVGEVVCVAGELDQLESGAVSLGVAPRDWTLVQRNLLDDLHNTEWGADWHNAAVIAMSLGANGAAFFDAIEAERTPGWVALYSSGSGAEVGKYNPVTGQEGAQSYPLSKGTQYLAFDLGSSQLVSRVDSRFGADKFGAYEIQASNDPDFSEYAIGAKSGAATDKAEDGWLVHTFTQPINARYVRLAFTEPYKGATVDDLQLRAFTR